MSRRKKGDKIDGWVVLDKPLGLGSTPAVSRVRRLFGAQKAGHGGTLDPLATGVLPIALGEATKTVPFVMDGRKEYRFTLKFGEARAGELVELKLLRVQIDRLEFLARPDAEHADFVVGCGKGTYIRSLGRDLALALGTVGHLSALRRTAAGPFREEAAISLPKLEALGHIPALFGALVPVVTALDDIPALALTEAQADQLRHGQPVFLTRDAPPSGALVRAESGEKLVALVRSDGVSLQPVRVFNL